MWNIYEKKSLAKIIKELPKNVLKHYEVWKRIVELQGPQGLRLIKGFHDEALGGNWKGFRSSRLTKHWRVFYMVEHTILKVYVIDVNHHDYKRKD